MLWDLKKQKKRNVAQRDGTEDENGLRMGAAEFGKLVFWLKLVFFWLFQSTLALE